MYKNKKFKIIFFGTPKIAGCLLESLLKNKALEIKLVVTQPERKQGRKKTLVLNEVHEIANKHNLNILQPNKVIDIYEQIKIIDPDALLTCAYGQFIPNKILNLAIINCLNFHASLLPQLRGGAPIEWAIIKGFKQTGISIMKMVRKMDAGDVYKQEIIKIDSDDDLKSLTSKLTKCAISVCNKYLINILKNEINPIPQNENKVTFGLNIKREDERINWNQNAVDVHNLIRGLSPKPGAFTFINDTILKIYKSETIINNNEYDKYNKTPPGMVLKGDKKGIIIKCKDSYLRVILIQKSGKKITFASSYFNNAIKVNDLFI